MPVKKDLTHPGRLLIIVRIVVSRAVNAKNMYYWYMAGRKIVSTISAASIKATAIPQLTYFKILCSASNMRCNIKTARGIFHMSQLKTKANATALTYLRLSAV